MSALRNLPVPLALAIALAGCAGLPDQRLANEALKRGDTVTAQQNYQQLADLGYSEAQVGLADIQVDSRDPTQMKQAEATYRAAASVSPRVLNLPSASVWGRADGARLEFLRGWLNDDGAVLDLVTIGEVVLEAARAAAKRLICFDMQRIADDSGSVISAALFGRPLRPAQEGGTRGLCSRKR